MALKSEFTKYALPVLLSLLINRIKIVKTKTIFSICMNNLE